MKERKNRKGILHIIQNCAYCMGYMFRTAPFFTIFGHVTLIMFGVCGIVQNFYLKYIVDAIGTGAGFSDILPATIGMFALNAFTVISFYFYNNALGMENQVKLKNRMHSELFEKAAKIDLACYDNPEFYNDFIWAINEADTRTVAVYSNTVDLFRAIVQILGGFLIIGLLDPTLIILAVVAFGGSFTFSILQNKRQLQFDEECKPVIRKRDYISRVFYLPEYAKELRLTTAGKRLIGEFHDAIEMLKGIVHKHGIKMAILQFIQSYVMWSLLIDVLATLIIAYRVLVTKTVTLGAFLPLINAVESLTGGFSWIMQVLSKYQQSSPYIDKFRKFMDYEIQIKEEPSDFKMDTVPQTLEVKGITFAYSDQSVLQHITFKIQPYEKIALVGYNGAGKTTLVKLLMRLYDVTEGCISVGGTDIRKYNVSDYRSAFGAAFQDYQIFAATIAENVAMMPITDEMRPAIVHALEIAGFGERLQSLPNGIDTLLVREFDESSINLSGGEMQKIAIARVFFKNCPYIILDEPSAQLDPDSEYNLNRSIMEKAANKTVIFISHRLSTTVMADRIYMFENGEIIEQGTHAELMHQNGKYAEMFHIQSDQYIGNATIV